MAPRRPARDFVSEMEALVRAECEGDEPFTATGIAETIVEKLRANDRELLRGWLDMQAADILRNYVATIARSDRSHNRAMSRRIKFRQALDDHAGGDPHAITTWLATTFVVNADAIRKQLGKMTKDELIFVAENYERNAMAAEFEAQWFRALAKRVGNGLVEDVFTEDQIVDIRNSIDSMFGRR